MGVVTGRDLAQAMSALMADVADGRMQPGQAHAICSAARNLIKIAELRLKHGAQQSESLMLVEPPTLRATNLRTDKAA